MTQEYYLEFPNNIDAFPESIRGSFIDKYDVAILIKYKPHLFDDEGVIEYIIAGRDGKVEPLSYRNTCHYPEGKFDLYTINGMLIIGGFDNYEFDLNKLNEFHEKTFILYWGTRSYGVDRGVYISYKRVPSTLWYDFSGAIGLVLNIDFNTFVNHQNSVPISPRGIFYDIYDLINKIGYDHLLEGFVSCCRKYVVSDFYIAGKNLKFIGNIEEHKNLNPSIPYRLLSFVENGIIVSSNLFQDLEAPKYNNEQYDFLVLINDRVGVFSKEGYRVKPIYDAGYSDLCHYSVIASENGKKWYWDVDYRTYKMTPGRYDFHLKRLEEDENLFSKDSLSRIKASIQEQCDYARKINEHPELEKKPNYEHYEWTEEDTWDAMTDGMYGDYPGSGFDYEVLGF